MRGISDNGLRRLAKVGKDSGQFEKYISKLNKGETVVISSNAYDAFTDYLNEVDPTRFKYLVSRDQFGTDDLLMYFLTQTEYDDGVNSYNNESRLDPDRCGSAAIEETIMQGLTKAAYARLAKIGQSDPGYTPVALSFEDLEPKARERALDKMRGFIEGEFDLSAGDMIDRLKDEAPDYFDVEDIQYSGFASQGDGASWTGNVNLKKWCEKNSPEALPFVNDNEIETWAAVVRTDSHYVHENTIRVEVIEHATKVTYDSSPFEGSLEEYYAHVEGVVDDLVLEVTDAVKDFCREIYKELEEEYNYTQTDEYLMDLIEANQYDFTADGDLA